METVAKPEVQFSEAMAQRNLIPPDELIADGKIHRCKVVGHRGEDGAYLLHLDGIPAGGFENHADGLDWENWRADLGRVLTPMEEASYQSQVKAAMALRKAEDDRRKAEARERAGTLLGSAPPCLQHPYLTRKGIQPHGVGQIGDELVIPMRSASGTLHSIQWIDKAGNKLFLSGGRKQGCFHMLGMAGNGPLCIVEGFATGASVHEATGHAVAIAFDCGNLLPVAKDLRALYPHSEFIFCADDDVRIEGNPGQTKAIAAAKAVGGRVALPDFGPNRLKGQTDFNDLHQARGLGAVRDAVAFSNPLGEAPRRLAVCTWDDFRGKPIPPVQWLLDPYLPAVGYGTLVSHPGHGKSIFSLQASVAMATGLPLFGQTMGEPGGVGLLALEDGKNTVHRRLAAIVSSYGRDFTEEHHRLLIANLRIVQRARRDISALRGEIQGMHLAGLAWELGDAMQTTQAPPKLMFIDTYHSVHGGDENSAKDTGPLTDAVEALSSSLNCSIYALHHLRKSGTGKNAPLLADRLNPELVRGSSALVGDVRAVCQFGWITSPEAEKAGLNPMNADRRYAIFGLTKFNDGPLSPWMLLEHSQVEGLWIPVAHGEAILAKLRGAAAVKALGKMEALLLELKRGIQDRDVLAATIWPELPSKDGKEKLKSTLSDMRRGAYKWLQPNSMELTVPGFTKAQSIESDSAPNPTHEEFNDDAA
jgi:putative DNA primase/helicase